MSTALFVAHREFFAVAMAWPRSASLLGAIFLLAIYKPQRPLVLLASILNQTAKMSFDFRAQQKNSLPFSRTLPDFRKMIGSRSTLSDC
jgi:hypothetical protein